MASWSVQAGHKFLSLLTYLHLSTDHDPRSGLEPAVFELRIPIHITGVWTLVDGVDGRFWANWRRVDPSGLSP